MTADGIEITDRLIDAAEVIQRDSIEPMVSEEFMVHMASVIEELNLRAREASVQVLKDPTNTSIRIPYNFTFMIQ